MDDEFFSRTDKFMGIYEPAPNTFTDVELHEAIGLYKDIIGSEDLQNFEAVLQACHEREIEYGALSHENEGDIDDLDIEIEIAMTDLAAAQDEEYKLFIRSDRIIEDEAQRRATAIVADRMKYLEEVKSNQLRLLEKDHHYAELTTAERIKGEQMERYKVLTKEFNNRCYLKAKAEREAAVQKARKATTAAAEAKKPNPMPTKDLGFSGHTFTLAIRSHPTKVAKPASTSASACSTPTPAGAAKKGEGDKKDGKKKKVVKKNKKKNQQQQAQPRSKAALLTDLYSPYVSGLEITEDQLPPLTVLDAAAQIRPMQRWVAFDWNVMLR